MTTNFGWINLCVTIGGSYHIRTAHLVNKTDENIKNFVKTKLSHANGNYCHSVCRRCGEYITGDTDCSTDDMTVKDKCKSCFELTDEQISGLQLT